MKTVKVADAGINPTITFDGVAIKVSWQLGAVVGIADVDPDALTVDFVQSKTLNGGEAAYPEVFHDGTTTWLAYRDGAWPYEGHLINEETGKEHRNLGQIHGSRPVAFGNVNEFAYISAGAAAQWPVRKMELPGGTAAIVRLHAEGTGLSRIDDDGKVISINEDRNAVPGISDPSFGGDAVIGTSDRDGQPCLVALRNGEECVVWQGQDSQNPRMIQVGSRWFFVAWSAKGEGIRLGRLEESDFTDPAYSKTPESYTRAQHSKYVGYWFDHGKYGDFFPQTNTTVLDSTMYEDGDGNLPDNVEELLTNAAEFTERILCGDDELSMVVLAPFWSKVLGVYIHEPDYPEQATVLGNMAKSLMTSLGLPQRPIVGVYTAAQSIDVTYRDKVDIVMPEIYFDDPAASYDAMTSIVLDRLVKVLNTHKGKILLIPQTYDRNRDPAWMNAPDMVEVILYECGEAMMVNERIIGCVGFAYARPGGATTYKQWQEWYDGMMTKIPGAPPMLDDGVVDPPEPKPPTEEDMFYPNDEQNTNMLQRIAVDYVNVLKRVAPPEAPHSGEGIYRVPPDGLNVAIHDNSRGDGVANGPVRIDTKSLAVWLGRYFHYFNEFNADHERAAQATLKDIRNSPEGQAANPQ
jgi:hypothetical protein